MNVFRNFLIIGNLYLLVGLLMGMYMGGAGEFSFSSLHAHLNLLGFTLMLIFAAVYKLVPAMADSRLAVVHFWFYQIGTIVLTIMLFLLVTGKITPAGMSPVAPLAEAAILIGAVCFCWNAYKNAD